MASDAGALKDWTVKSLRVALHSVGLSTYGSKVELFTRYNTYTMQQIEKDDAPAANATTSLKADGTDKSDGQGGAAGTSASGVADEVVAGPTVGDPAAAGADGGGVDGEARVSRRDGTVGEVGGALRSADVQGGTTHGNVAGTSGEVSCGPTGAVEPASVQAPVFTKHEFGRLFHIMAKPEIAAAIVKSKGRLSRHELDAGVKRGAIWVSDVAFEFNLPSIFVPPSSCTDLGIDPNIHPHARFGEKLKAKFHEVRSESASWVDASGRRRERYVKELRRYASLAVRDLCPCYPSMDSFVAFMPGLLPFLERLALLVVFLCTTMHRSATRCTRY